MNSTERELILQWLRERCARAPAGAFVRPRELYADYAAWCSRRAVTGIGRTTLYRFLEEDVDLRRMNTLGIVFHGIRLLHSSPDK